MKPLVTFSQKGGVGKTTVALNLALATAERGHRTLLVDADLQGAIGLSLRSERVGRPALGAWTLGKVELAEAVLDTREPNLAILPMGHVDVRDMDAVHDRLSTAATFEALRSALDGGYDLVIVDTPGGLVGPAAAAARALGHLLVPLQAEPLALRTIPRLLERIAVFRELGADVQLAGIVLTMTSFKDPTSLEVLEEAWSLFPELVLETHVPRDPSFGRASAAGVPVAFLSRRRPPAAAAFERLAAELEPRLDLRASERDEAPRSLLD